ncbi:hypothetical protein MSAN_02397300 [Mycena sanguinolenta]|uniref:Uncharacterized protein n=1 Tax=Mycena sanguinolenta TaxID=230812 RepID=A0A8H6X411_9AGAR|nr:hypothetical protein MSAN_02397300 [Mycena sanguinolenta]
MRESIIFDNIVNSRWSMRTSIILFLTEIKVFRAKIHRIPLSAYFPEYIGSLDINNATQFILWRFMQANRAKLSVYPHLAHTTDTANMRLVFAAVKETILQNALKDSKVLGTRCPGPWAFPCFGRAGRSFLVPHSLAHESDVG